MLQRALALVGVGLLSGCATLFSGTSQEVTFTSDPSGAAVLLDGFSVGSTPLVHEVDRETFKRTQVMVRKQGYLTEQFQLKKTLNTVALINCFSWPSWITDGVTGAMMEYSPDKYFVELTPKRRKKADHSHRRALQFVLVNHRAITRAIARREGEHLHALAVLFGVPEEQYPLFNETLGEHAPELVAHEHPNDLFRALSRLLEPYGWKPHDPDQLHFNNALEIIPRFRSEPHVAALSQPVLSESRVVLGFSKL